jgi:hypothetical protein
MSVPSRMTDILPVSPSRLTGLPVESPSSYSPGGTLRNVKEPSGARGALPILIPPPPTPNPAASMNRTVRPTARPASDCPRESTATPEIFAGRPGIRAKSASRICCPTPTSMERAAHRGCPGKKRRRESHQMTLAVRDDRPRFTRHRADVVAPRRQPRQPELARIVGALETT